MKRENFLGFLILSEFVLGIMATVSYHRLEPFLPASLRAYPAPDGIAVVLDKETAALGRESPYVEL